MKRSYRWKSIGAGLTALMIAFAVVAYVFQSQAQATNRQLNAVYQRAFYEICELSAGMQGNLKKVLVAGSVATEQKLLTAIARSAQGIESHLASLPIGGDAMNATMKFINQTGDYCAALANQLAGGAAVSESDRQILSTLLTTCTDFALSLNDLMARYQDGTLVFSDYDFSYDGENPLEPLTHPASMYPVLLYDGPFSDGQPDYGEKLSALPGASYTVGQAKRALERFVGPGIEQVAFSGMATIPVTCYEFSFAYHGYGMTASVTETGGYVLTMLCETAVSDGAIAPERCAQIAQDYLAERAFPEMAVRFYSDYEGVTTVNLAAVQSGVVLYPDLVKVQVSMADGSVIGVEARNYYANHTTRALPTTVMTEAEAMARVGQALTPERARLCVIPLDVGEAYCYEVLATDGKDRYRVYIDVESGAERLILQEVETENGTLSQ